MLPALQAIYDNDYKFNIHLISFMANFRIKIDNNYQYYKRKLHEKNTPLNGHGIIDRLNEAFCRIRQ